VFLLRVLSAFTRSPLHHAPLFLTFPSPSLRPPYYHTSFCVRCDALSFLLARPAATTLSCAGASLVLREFSELTYTQTSIEPPTPDSSTFSSPNDDERKKTKPNTWFFFFAPTQRTAPRGLSTTIKHNAKQQQRQLSKT